MNIVLRIVLIVITLIYLAYLIRSVKNKKLQISFSTFWIISSVILIIAISVPNLIEWISYTLGFATPSNMIFVLAIFLSFCLIFDLTTKLSQEHKKNVLLIQEISILKERVNKIENKHNNIEE